MGDTGVTLTESCEGLSSATVVPTTNSLVQGFICRRGEGHRALSDFPPLLNLVLKYTS